MKKSKSKDDHNRDIQETSFSCGAKTNHQTSEKGTATCNSRTRPGDEATKEDKETNANLPINPNGPNPSGNTDDNQDGIPLSDLNGKPHSNSGEGKKEEEMRLIDLEADDDDPLVKKRSSSLSSSDDVATKLELDPQALASQLAELAKGEDSAPRANGAVCTEPPADIECAGDDDDDDDKEDKDGSRANLVDEPESGVGKYLRNLHKTNPDSVLNELPTCCILLPEVIYRTLFK